MDIYEVHVFTARRSTRVSDWNATKSGKVRLTLNNRLYLKIRLKLRMSSLNNSPWHDPKQAHRQGWQFQFIKKEKKPFPFINYTNMQWTECPEICAQTSHIHLMNTMIKTSFDKSFTSASCIKNAIKFNVMSNSIGTFMPTDLNNQSL